MFICKSYNYPYKSNNYESNLLEHACREKIMKVRIRYILHLEFSRTFLVQVDAGPVLLDCHY